MENWIDSQFSNFIYNEECEGWSKIFYLDAFSVFTDERYYDGNTEINRTYNSSWTCL